MTDANAGDLYWRWTFIMCP